MPKTLPEQWEYQQPDFYKFGSDPIILVNELIGILSKNEKVDPSNRPYNVLDIGAGCGVLGIEFAQKQAGISQLYFIELQSDFLPFLNRNISTLIPHVSARVIQGDFFTIDHGAFEGFKTFDILLCNPPFYHFNKSKEIKDRKRRLCRQSGLLLHQWFENILKFTHSKSYIGMCLPDESCLKSFSRMPSLVKSVGQNKVIAVWQGY